MDRVICTDDMKEQLKKVLDQGNRREQAERVRKTLKTLSEKKSMPQPLFCPICESELVRLINGEGFNLPNEGLKDGFKCPSDHYSLVTWIELAENRVRYQLFGEFYDLESRSDREAFNKAIAAGKKRDIFSPWEPQLEN